MNAKNKVIALVMSCFICFGTVSTSFCNDKKYLTSNNINPIVLDGGVISAPMVATISTLAVASGIALSSDDDIYDIACLFYEKYKDNWEQINLVFDTCVSIGANKVVTVGKEFLELVKACFDDVFLNASGNIGIKSNLSYMDGVSLVLTSDLFVDSWSPGEYKEFYVNDNYGYYCQVYGYGRNLSIGLLSNVDGSWVRQDTTIVFPSAFGISNGLFSKGSTIDFIIKNSMLCLVLNDKVFEWKPIDYEFELPYTPGSYAPGGVLDGSDSLGIYVPSKPSSLVGANPSDVVLGGNPSYEYGDTITLPNVSNPSIDTSLEGTFNPSIPSDNIFSNVRDFIISLVVPSDTFWTDLFTGFRDNLNKNFPMLDMSSFDSLLVEGKPFPNMFAFGGKIVDGDTINSVVDWLRPIVAGFVMLLLLFFNYRKLHKIIRNSDPYGSVAEKGCTSNVN